jgi:hypothetical protein
MSAATRKDLPTMRPGASYGPMSTVRTEAMSSILSSAVVATASRPLPGARSANGVAQPGLKQPVHYWVPISIARRLAPESDPDHRILWISTLAAETLVRLTLGNGCPSAKTIFSTISASSCPNRPVERCTGPRATTPPLTIDLAREPVGSELGKVVLPA